MLNPIDNVFSVFKSAVKAFLAARCDSILHPPPGVTKAQHRANYMLRAARHSMSTKVTAVHTKPVSTAVSSAWT
jgi:hypothetical protein